MRKGWQFVFTLLPLNILFIYQLVNDGTSAIAEVEFFFQLRFGDTVHTLALVSMFSPPDQETLELSNHTAYICRRGGTDALTVIEVKTIIAVVAMVPDYQVTIDGDIITPENVFSLVEAPFLKLTTLCGTLDEDGTGNDFDNATETAELFT